MEQMQEAPRIDVGTVLREARERMGMSVEDVAGRLKFATRQISALEDGNFEQLPEPAFVRGFVRSYARLLQLDEAPLLAALPSAPVAEPLAEIRAKPDLLPGAAAARAQNVRWLGGALVVALVIAVVAWQHDGGQPAPKEAGSAKPQATAASAPEAAPAGADTGSQPEGAAGVAPAVPAQAAAPAAQAQPEAAKQPAAPSPAPAHAVQNNTQHAGSPASGVAADGSPRKRPGRLLRLEFEQESWVEVKDANGKTLLMTVGKPGTVQSVSGQAPLSLTIGNAQGVKAYYKGQLLDMSEDTEANVVHMTLE